MNNPKKSIGVSFAGQYAELAIHFVGVTIVARLLTPGDIGIYTVGAFLMAVLHAFRDFGVGQYIIQEHELTSEKVRSATGVAILLASAVATLLFICAKLIADLYGQPALYDIMLVTALSFAISPWGSMVHGILRREMEFKKIFVVQIIAALFHVGVAITLASRGYGALSLAWANFGGILATGVAFSCLRPKWVPLLPRFKRIKPILAYGSVASIGNAANTAGANAPDLIVGKMMDMAAVGYLSRANGLVQLFTRLLTQGVLPLILPYFAHAHRKGEKLSDHFQTSTVYLTAFSWPFFAVMTVLAEPVILTLYGAQWIPSVPLTRWLCFAGALASLTLFACQAMVASGNVRDATRSQLLAQPIRIVAVALAAAYGLTVVAAAIVLSECAALLIVYRYLGKTTGVSLRLVLQGCRRNLVLTMTSVALPLMARVFWEVNGAAPWVALVLGGLGAAVGWACGLALTRHPLIVHLSPLLQAIGLGSKPASAEDVISQVER